MSPFLIALALVASPQVPPSDTQLPRANATAAGTAIDATTIHTTTQTTTHTTGPATGPAMGPATGKATEAATEFVLDRAQSLRGFERFRLDPERASALRSTRASRGPGEASDARIVEADGDLRPKLVRGDDGRLWCRAPAELPEGSEPNLSTFRPDGTLAPVVSDDELGARLVRDFLDLPPGATIEEEPIVMSGEGSEGEEPEAGDRQRDWKFQPLPDQAYVWVPPDFRERRGELSDKELQIETPLLVARDDGAGSDPSWERLEIRVRANPGQAAWDPSERMYRTSLFVYLQGDSGAERALAAPINVLLSAEQGVIAQPLLLFDQVGPRGMRSVELLCDPHDCRPVVLAESGVRVGELTLPVRVRLGGVKFEPGRRRLMGFGLEEVELRVTRLADDGLPWAADEELSIAIGLDRGRATTSDVRIAAGEASASVRLRSEGFGDARVIASHGAFEDETVYDFYLPWFVLLVALVMGAAGGAVRGWLLPLPARVAIEERPAWRKRLVWCAALFGFAAYLLACADESYEVGFLKGMSLSRSFTLSAGGAALFGLAGGLAMLGSKELLDFVRAKRGGADGDDEGDEAGSGASTAPGGAGATGE